MIEAAESGGRESERERERVIDVQDREGDEEREDNGDKVAGSGEAEEYYGVGGVAVEVEDEAVDDTGDDVGVAVDVLRPIDGVGGYVGP